MRQMFKEYLILKTAVLRLCEDALKIYLNKLKKCQYFAIFWTKIYKGRIFLVQFIIVKGCRSKVPNFHFLPAIIV